MRGVVYLIIVLSVWHNNIIIYQTLSKHVHSYTVDNGAISEMSPYWLLFMALSAQPY